MADVDLKWHGAKVKAMLHAAGVEGAGEAAEHLLAESVKLVPIEEATLERSGTTSVDAAKGKAAVSYDTEYAVVQHEDPDLQHDAGRQHNYLAQPMATEAPVLKAIIANAVKRRIK